MSTDGPRILVVEDEAQVRRFLRATLSSHGYSLLEAETGTVGLQLASSHNPELILLDLGLPDLDGVEVVKLMREWSRVPIIILSARGREDDKVLALDAGADDYLTKPFGANELLARLRACLRRAASEGAREELVVEAGALRVDLIKRQVAVSGKEVHLTPTEYRLLAVLVKSLGKVITHGQLLREVWGPHHQTQTQYLRVYMGQLRRKIESDPNRPSLLMTEPGVGYRIREGLLETP